MKDSMKTILSLVLATLWAMMLLQFSACAVRKEAPDPIKVQEKIAEYRSQELELVRATITDPGRLERMTRLLDDRDRLIADSKDMIISYRQQMTRLNSDYYAERFEALVDRFNLQRVDAQHQYIALVEAMKAETEPGEWKAISKFQKKRLHPRELSYGQAARED
jgi:predicted component of type VI protein secretion system